MTSHVYVIAGPNGAGKTTFAREFLPNYAHCPNFLNADLIAADLSPLAPESAAMAAGRRMLEQIEHLAARRDDFGLEITLAGRVHLKLIRNLKLSGYEVRFFYLWLPSVELALSRVRERVSRGGHDIPEYIVRRRFDFWSRYRFVADRWMFFDNSEQLPFVIASEVIGTMRVADEKLYSIAMESL